MSIVFVFQYRQSKVENWFATLHPEDYLLHNIQQVAASESVNLVALHESPQNHTIGGITYWFEKDFSGIVERLEKLRPDKLVLIGFHTHTNPIIVRRLPDAFKVAILRGPKLRGIYPIISEIDRIVVPHEFQANQLMHDTGISSDRIVIVPEAVDIELFRPVNQTKRYDAIYPGRFLDFKRQHLAAQAVEHINGSLLLIGPSQDKSEVKRSLTKGISFLRRKRKGISYLRPVPRLVMPDYYAQARLCLMTSSKEAGPRVTIEAMACGLPVVGCDDCLANVDTIRASGGGVIARPTPKDVARAVVAALDGRERFGERGRDFVVQNHSYRHHLTKLREALGV